MSDPLLVAGKRANRRPALTEKVPKEETGFKAAIYIHYTFSQDMTEIETIWFSEPKKEGSALERLLDGIGERVTAQLRERRKARAE